MLVLIAAYSPKSYNSCLTFSNLLFCDIKLARRAATSGFSDSSKANLAVASALPEPSFLYKADCSPLAIALTKVRSINSGMMSMIFCKSG